MIIMLSGKQRKVGTSKRGNDYDFIVLHFLAPARGVEGEAAVEKLVDSSVFEYDKLLIGAHYDLDVDLDGSVYAIHPCKS